MKIVLNRFIKFIGIVCSILLVTALCYGQVERETWQPPEKILDAIGIRPRFARHYREEHHGRENALPVIHDESPDPQHGMRNRLRT